jgi:hypothetical protein
VLRDYSVAHETVWGELVFGLFLRSRGLDPVMAATAADGWGGDRALVLARGTGPGPSIDMRPERAIAIGRSEWDSEADAIEAHEALVKALDGSLAGAVLDHQHTRTRWLAVDQTVTWVERRGTAIAIVHGAPAWTAERLAVEVWSSSRVVAPPARPARKP